MRRLLILTEAYTSEQMHEWISFDRKIFLWYMIESIFKACFEIDKQIRDGVSISIVKENKMIVDFFMKEHVLSFDVPVPVKTHQSVFRSLLAPSNKASK